MLEIPSKSNCGGTCKPTCKKQQNSPTKENQTGSTQEKYMESPSVQPPQSLLIQGVNRSPDRQLSQKMVFKIDGMCCATQSEILRGALSPLIAGTDITINFDLINSKLILDGKIDSLPHQEKIKHAISKTGMVAVEWGDHVQLDKTQSFWQKYKYFIMNMASLVGLVVGFALHFAADGEEAALGQSSEGEGQRIDFPPTQVLVVYSLGLVSGGWFIFPKAFYALIALRLDPNFLMTLAILGAVGTNHWFEAVSSMYLFSLVGIVERWNISRARQAIRSLMELTPSTARVVSQDGMATEVLVEQVAVGAVISVKPGEKIPMDSLLIQGTTSVNQAPITGESMPIEKDIGDKLFAGSINGDGAIQCRVTKASSDSTLANIIKKVEEAQSRRARSDQWIEKFSHYYIPSVMIVSIAVIVIPPLASGNQGEGKTWYPWINRGLNLLVVSCPCSLVISTPICIVAGIAAAARSGVLIKGGVYLETAAAAKAFAMDQTGTLTKGEPVVEHINPINGHTSKSLLQLAASLETHSDHPLARAIQNQSLQEGIKYQPAEGFQALKGRGAEGVVGGTLFWVGSHSYMHEKLRDQESEELHRSIQQVESQGHSIIALGDERNLCGWISITDRPREESRSAILALKAAGIQKVVMLTGDNQGAAQTIADSVGVDEYYAELLPEDKVKQVEGLVAKHGVVAMVGDGVNDAPAMAVASLAVAMGVAGSDAAIETADIALMSDDLAKLPWLVCHSHFTTRVIKQNVVFSLLLQAIFVWLIFADLSTLWMAMGADLGATFIVVSNALRLTGNTHISRSGPKQDATRQEKSSNTKLVAKICQPTAAPTCIEPKPDSCCKSQCQQNLNND